MRPETSKQLEAILNSRQQQKREAETRASERQNTEARNLVDFAAKKESVIKPALQEIIDLYKTKGVHLQIEEDDERPRGRSGGFDGAYVGLNMAAAYAGYSGMKAEFKLMFQKTESNAFTVHVYHLASRASRERIARLHYC